MENTLIGLTIVSLGWLIQAIYSWKGRKDVQDWFLVLYLIGVAVLIFDGFVNDLAGMAILNLASFVFALIVWMKVNNSKKVGSIVKSSKKARRR